MSGQVRREDFGSLTDEWRALCGETPAASVFNTPDWLSAWWESCGGSQELHLFSFREDGALKGVAPMMQEGDTLRFIGLSDLCDNHDFPMAEGAGEEFVSSFFDGVESTEWRTMELDGLFEGSATLDLLAQAARSRGFALEMAFDEVSPVRRLSETWEEYLQSLRKKDRHELRRKFRRLYGAGEVRYYNCAGSANLSQDLPIFLELLKTSREDKAKFLTPGRERFFHTLADALVKAGSLKLFFLELDGVKVAASLCFDYGDAYFLYNSGYDPSYAPLSVGLMLKTLCLQDAIEQGRRQFHFGRGAEPYKYDLGAEDLRLMKVTISR